jgi:hypothetical protein
MEEVRVGVSEGVEVKVAEAVSEAVDVWEAVALGVIEFVGV